MVFTRVVHMALFIKNSYTSRWCFLLWRKPCVIRVYVEAMSYNRLCSINIQPSITCVCKSTLNHITVKVNIPQPLQLLCKLLMKTLRHRLFTARIPPVMITLIRKELVSVITKMIWKNRGRVISLRPSVVIRFNVLTGHAATLVKGYVQKRQPQEAESKSLMTLKTRNYLTLHSLSKTCNAQ